MGIINLLEKRNKKTNKDGIDNLFNYKLNEQVDDLFKSELKNLEIWIYPIRYSEKPLVDVRNKKIKELEIVYNKYFNLSNNIQNKFNLLKCFAMMSEKYNKKLIDFLKENLLEILETGTIEEVISKLEGVNKQTKEVEEFIKHLSNIKNDKVCNCIGGIITPSYRDIQESSISIGREYNFQQA